VKYKAHFEHEIRNPNCHFGGGMKPTEAIERHLREAQIVRMEPILAGTAYWGRAEAEFANAMAAEEDLKKKKEMQGRYNELAERLKNLSIKEREQTLLDEIKKWKKERRSV
jgi:hypothetical protein